MSVAIRAKPSASYHSMDDDKPKLRCIAEQVSKAQLSAADARPQSARTGQWSADGTCIVHVSPGNSIETVVLPEDLLTENEQHDLHAYSRFESRDPIYSTALYPHFTLGNPTTTLVLSAARDTPIQLRNALDFDRGIYATYAWYDPHTEAVITPRCLAFTGDASHFVAGAKAQFSIYDVNRPSPDPVRHRKTSKSRYALKTYGPDPRLDSTGPSSIITALDIHDSEDILALGTNTRDIVLYANHGLGDLITTFKMPSSGNNTTTVSRGVSNIKWSPDGTYLFVAERQSDIIEIYDIRQSCRRLGWLSGRKATVAFQMGFDLAPTVHGLQVWAGGTDGYTRMWSHPEQQEGEVKWTEEWKVHDDPACATLVHASGSVVATLATRDRYASNNADIGRPQDTVSDSDSDSGDNSDGFNEETSSDSASSNSSNASEDGVLTVNAGAMLKVWSIT